MAERAVPPKSRSGKLSLDYRSSAGGRALRGSGELVDRLAGRVLWGIHTVLRGRVVLGKDAACRGCVVGLVEVLGRRDAAGLQCQRDTVGDPPPQVDAVRPFRLQRP